MIVGHSLIALTGAFLIYDFFRSKSIKKNEEINIAKQRLKSVKLCLTGGPCGGKSSGINCIYNTFKQISAPFLIVPEAATIIGSAGLTLDLSNFTPSQIQSFQIYLMRLQYNLESIVQDVANTLAQLGKSVIILCDRGLLDGKAYAGEQNWNRMLKRINLTEEEINARYQAVFHMQTAARGAAQSYRAIRSQNDLSQINQEQVQVNKVRKQSPETAIQLDEKIQNCYINHPCRFIIRNYFFVKDFNIKTVLLVAVVNQMLEFTLRKVSIENYFSEYQKVSSNTRKLSEDDLELNVSPYLIRKRKYKKWKRERSSSPNHRF